MNVKEILEEYLELRRLDGLCYPDLSCCCVVDDLMPCGSCPDLCRPGYRVPCDGGDPDRPGSCDGDCEFHIRAARPKPDPGREEKQ